MRCAARSVIPHASAISRSRISGSWATHSSTCAWLVMNFQSAIGRSPEVIPDSHYWKSCSGNWDSSHEHVRRLQIAVDDALLVRVLHGVGRRATKQARRASECRDPLRIGNTARSVVPATYSIAKYGRPVVRGAAVVHAARCRDGPGPRAPAARPRSVATTRRVSMPRRTTFSATLRRRRASLLGEVDVPMPPRRACGLACTRQSVESAGSVPASGLLREVCVSNSCCPRRTPASGSPAPPRVGPLLRDSASSGRARWRGSRAWTRGRDVRCRASRVGCP